MHNPSRFLLPVLSQGQPSRPTPGFVFLGAVVTENERKEVSYSIWFNAGRRVRSSASVAILRGCLGSRAMRVRSRLDTCAARSAGVVELVFANMGVHKRMHRFTVRTKMKVAVQWTRTRFALVHNLGKIHTFGALH